MYHLLGLLYVILICNNIFHHLTILPTRRLSLLSHSNLPPISNRSHNEVTKESQRRNNIFELYIPLMTTEWHLEPLSITYFHLQQKSYTNNRMSSDAGASSILHIYLLYYVYDSIEVKVTLYLSLPY